MGIEIDMLSCGNASAVAVHLVTRSTSFVAVIDGGYAAQAGHLLHIIKNYYGRDSIDLLISTHPDKDHIGGLSQLAALITVHRAWIHNPKNHSRALLRMRVAATIRGRPLPAYLTESIQQANDLIAFLDARRIPREEPFSGITYGPITVLGPSESFYETMLGSFGQSEDIETDELLEAHDALSSALAQFLATKSALEDETRTTEENNSSSVLFLKYAGHTCLFTGDAGQAAIQDAQSRWVFANADWLQVPHHGSKRNLSSPIVSYLAPRMSYISAAGDRKHPSQAVVNALKQYGRAYSTHKSGHLRYAWGAYMSARQGYCPAIPL